MTTPWRLHRLLAIAAAVFGCMAGVDTAMMARAERPMLPQPVIIVAPRELDAEEYAMESLDTAICEAPEVHEACGKKPPPSDRRWHPRPGDVDRSDCPPLRYRMHPCERAGYPHAIAPWAIPSVSTCYEACWVGGGLSIGGRRRTANEGTWGLDYAGWLPRKLWLAWGAPRQGGEAGYETDHVPLGEKFAH